MNSGRTSLSALAQKWLGRDAATPKRVTRIRHPRHEGCVEVEMARPEGDVSLLFFRHRDGSWCVYPPS